MELPAWVVWLSVTTNHLTLGPKGYSLCARWHERRLNGCKRSHLFTKITDRIFWFDPQHCRKAWLMRNP